MARKRLAHLADEAPPYVVGVERVSRLWRLERTEADAKLVRCAAAQLELPGELLVVALSKPDAWLRKRPQALGGALLYER